MEYIISKRNDNIFCENKKISYIDSLNEQKLSLRSKKISKIISKKRIKILEQSKTINNDLIKKEHRIQIKKFSSSFNEIISYLKSNDDNLISYILDLLNEYFKLNEPDIEEQKLIIEGQFLEILLDLGLSFIKCKNEYDLEKILLIFMNIQIYNEGNNSYLNILYSEKFLEFTNYCFTQTDSDEIMNEIIILLYYTIKLNNEIIFKILQSKIIESIINFALNNSQDLDTLESIIKLIVNCLNIPQNHELNAKEINIINKFFLILKNELSQNENEKIQKLCYEGFYYLTKINNKYGYIEKIIKENIYIEILKIKSRYPLLNALTTLSNILTESDEILEQINLEEIICFYNKVLNLYDNDDKLIYIIFHGLVNISDSEYINVIESSIIWEKEKIQKYFNKNENIQILFIKIIKYMIRSGNNKALKFIYKTKILEYLIFLSANAECNEKIRIKIFKLIDNYLKRFKSEEKESVEYLIILNKFKDLISLLSDAINIKDEIIECIKEQYKII